ncbi:hypothetical protein C6W88_16610 [Halomonas litopenaei]|uniref:Type II toxin-antitoxin system HigB family toxin n=1 Tax=Halomonas litopenaei TaxID=2109328 RepID=A0ABX5IVR0_9GAMM|nr:hypothetical protein C6W89_15040 [Halomonas sp. SYSU XM8]PTL92611.1 hypothetical protein C6W88_16610 [Halomonas litopenaei]
MSVSHRHQEIGRERARGVPALRVRFHRVEYGSSVAIRYAQQIAWVRFVGTHAQYDQIDAETV